MLLFLSAHRGKALISSVHLILSALFMGILIFSGDCDFFNSQNAKEGDDKQDHMHTLLKSNERDVVVIKESVVA